MSDRTVMPELESPAKAHFDRLAGRWGRKYLPAGSLNPRIGRFLDPLTGRVAVAAEVLDFGCGTGDLSMACARAHYRVCGIDQSPSMVALARSHDAGGQVDFRVLAEANPPRLPFDDGRFRAVICSSVLEYCADPAACLRELRRVSSGGAWLFCTVPNITHRSRRVERLFQPFAGLVSPLLGGRIGDWFEYLALSRQRWPLEKWRGVFCRSGWSLPSVDGQDDALWLMVAQAGGARK